MEPTAARTVKASANRADFFRFTFKENPPFVNDERGTPNLSVRAAAEDETRTSGGCPLNIFEKYAWFDA